MKGKCDDTIRNIVKDCEWIEEFEKVLPEKHKGFDYKKLESKEVEDLSKQVEKPESKEVEDLSKKVDELNIAADKENDK